MSIDRLKKQVEELRNNQRRKIIIRSIPFDAAAGKKQPPQTDPAKLEIGIVTFRDSELSKHHTREHKRAAQAQQSSANQIDRTSPEEAA